MVFKKLFLLILVVVFVGTSVFPQFSCAAQTSQESLLEDLTQIEMAIYGVASEKPLVERVEYLEKELVGRTLPGTIPERVKQLKEFILLGTPEDPAVVFKINAAQWIVEKEVTPEPLTIRLENLENILFGKVSGEVLAMRAENIFEACFKEGKPQIEEVLIPAGTLVPIRFLSDLSSKKNEKGENFAFEVAENVFVDGKLVLPAGHQGIGEIIKAKEASILFRKGELELDFRIVLPLDATTINLTLGVEAEEENKRLIAAIGAGFLGVIILNNPIGLVAGALIPGENVKIEEGTEMFLQVESDTPAIVWVQ